MLLRDNIYEALRADILSCRLAPGEGIREQELAARYEVSRAPIRDALLRLENERLVTVHPRQGYSVNPISMADASELFQLRLLLETACVAATIESASADRLAGLEAYREYAPGRDFIEYNRAFHKAIAEASGNKRMAAIASELIDQGERLMRVSLANVKGRDTAQLVGEHVVLIDAMQARDARTATRIIRDHITKAERRVMSALGRSAIVS